MQIPPSLIEFVRALFQGPVWEGKIMKRAVTLKENYEFRRLYQRGKFAPLIQSAELIILFQCDRSLHNFPFPHWTLKQGPDKLDKGRRNLHSRRP